MISLLSSSLRYQCCPKMATAIHPSKGKTEPSEITSTENTKIINNAFAHIEHAYRYGCHVTREVQTC